MAALPEADVFESAPPAGRREIAGRFIAAILEALQAERRAPDAHEGRGLLGAIAALEVGMHDMAVLCGCQALTPPAGRAGLDRRPAKATTLSELRAALAAALAPVAAPPARQRPR